MRQVYAVVSHVTATNSPVTSDTVSSSVVDNAEVNNIVIETIAANETVQESTVNLSNGDKEIDAGATDNENGSGAYLFSMYSPDKDMLVEMDMYGAKGTDNGGNAGGECAARTAAGSVGANKGDDLTRRMLSWWCC